jgi:hypothetical protein
MRLIRAIPLDQVKVGIDQLSLDWPEFTLVISQGLLKIYKQVR